MKGLILKDFYNLTKQYLIIVLVILSFVSVS